MNYLERDSGSGYVEVGTVESNITEYTDMGLALGASYEYRVAAYTAINTSSYSATVTATAITPLVDYDGNIYEIIVIGDQLWMAENLKVTHYRDGTAIPNLTSDGDWTSTSSGAYCIYNNNAANEVDTYGALYNWHTVTDSINVAPAGWHVPTDAEWQTLVDYLGGSSVAGGKLKESGTSHWNGPNAGVTNESGFTALPGGARYGSDGGYGDMGAYGHFWSATELDSSTARSRVLTSSGSGVWRVNDDKRSGLTIRCVRD